MRTNRGSVGAIDEEGDAVRARRNARATHATRDRAVGRGAIAKRTSSFCQRAAGWMIIARALPCECLRLAG